MSRGARWGAGLLAGIVLALGTVRAAPRRGARPPTYDCDPGIPVPSTGTCACPDGYEPRVHDSKVPFCRKAANRSRPASIAATGQYEGPPGFDRGMQAVRHCGDHPESWVRASANLDTRTGIVAVDLQLETDSVAAGPRGRATVDVHGARGELLATIESTEVGIGGKPPGKARTQLYTASAALRASFARRAAALAIRVGCTGSIQQPFGVGGASSPGFQLTVK